MSAPLSEYTVKRADALNRMTLPDMVSPFPLRLLWLENIDSNVQSIYKKEHSHSFFEIHFVFSGEVSYELDSETVRLSAGEALLLPPETVHRFADCSERFFKNSLAFTQLGDKVPTVFSALTEPKCFRFGGEIAEAVNFILKQTETRDCFTPTIIGGRILEMLCAVTRSLGLTLPEAEEPACDSRLRAAKLFIATNLDRMITCEDAARECCLSRKQLNRVFKKHTGLTVQDYIADARAQYAKRLLDGGCSIGEISDRMGFLNVSAFNAFFKRHFGMPPGKYRAARSEDGEECPEKINICPDK